MTVSNSTHLRVSWNGLFTGCTSQDVGFLIMLAVPEQSSNSYDLSDSSKTFSAEFERREALVALDPCLSYQIYIRIFSNGGGSFRESKIIKYNDMSQQAHFYGGMLKEFLEKICLKNEEGVIRIGDPPEAVSKCILTRGEQVNDALTAPGQSIQIQLTILNPTNREPLNITANLNGIDRCARKVTARPRSRILSNTTASASKSVLKLGGGQSVIIFTASILATTLVIVLITMMVSSFKKKKRRRRSEVRMMKVDRNTDYGVFFSRAGNSYFKQTNK